MPAKLKRTTKAEKVLAKTEQDALEARYTLAVRHFRDFLPFVKIEESGTYRPIPFEMWPHLYGVVDDMELERLINYAKSRQVAVTTILSAYALWTASYVPNGEVLEMSKGEREANEFLSNSKEMWANLPTPLQAERCLPDNQSQMTFSHGGRIDALPSTADAGRGRNPVLAIFDEADFHEYLEEAVFSVKPGLDDRNGQLIMASTWNPYKIGSLFQRTYQNPQNGYKKRFFPYNVRPGRTEAWYEARKLESEDTALFEKEYPRSEEEMMAPANSSAFFDLPTIRLMRNDCRAPVEQVTVGNGIEANIYQKLLEGKRYTAATDTSHGGGQDYAVTVVMDVTTGYVVTDIYSSTIDPTELGIASVELLSMYDNPIWGIEDNDWGILTIRIAQELRYKRLYFHDEEALKPGWHTFDTAAHAAPGSRFVMLGDLYRAIKSRLITIPNEEGLNQFMTMIRNPKKNSRVEAQQGAHDDYPMAIAIAWQLRSQTHIAGGSRINLDRTFQTRSQRWAR